jgi:phosphoadenosine phosphosulfate reductase
MKVRVESALACLQQAAQLQPAVLSTSFGAEDMVLLDLIQRHQLPIAIFTLDTGRLPEETYRLMQAVEEHYGRCVSVVFPDPQAVQRLVAAIGINGFYDSVDSRKACCAVRKTEPLARALAGKSAWVTGLRAAQSVTRAQLPARERDGTYGVEKFNPLHDWSEADVWAYLRAGDVPYNELHDRFYPSIGCAPCTRAITPGEDIRAGRWWWENADTKECGLHGKPHSVGVSLEADVSAANVKAETEDSAGRRQHADSRQCVLRVRKPKVIEIKEYAL